MYFWGAQMLKYLDSLLCAQSAHGSEWVKKLLGRLKISFDFLQLGVGIAGRGEKLKMVNF